METPMGKYRCVRELGDGTCGTVYEAVNITSNETVAIKKMKRKFYAWEHCLVREINILRALDHPNIIKLKEVNVEKTADIFFVFEYMESNLFDVFRDRNQPFTENDLRNIFRQILCGLEHMHKHGFFHRDLKPENILMTNEVVKIADFGLAREIASGPPYTQYVSTRWYRAPEVILQCSYYTPAVDMWAVGAMLAELFTMSPLFPGTSEADQWHKICCILGSPDSNTWPDGFRLLQQKSYRFVHTTPTSLAAIIPNASSIAIDFIKKLCSWDPQRRPTAEEALQHPFFYMGWQVPRPLWDPPLSLSVLTYNVASRSQTREEGELELDLNLSCSGAHSEDSSLRLTLGGGARPRDSQPSGGAHQAFNQRGHEEMVLRSGIHNDHPGQTAFWPMTSANYEAGESSSSRAPIRPYYLFGSPSTFAAGR